MSDDKLAALRSEYRSHTLDEKVAVADPLAQFRLWLDEALLAGVREPTAMTLATVGEGGQPKARIVLLKSVSGGAFTFYTNLDSDKGRELAREPRAALLFFWPELERQVRIEGTTALVDDAQADAYFATRPRGSQLGAWASPQSRVVASRDVLTAELARVSARFGEGLVSRPPRWGGYALTANRLEFWQGRESRLHDRLLYTRRQGGTWQRERLAP
jgi:pyridoxamine 5'-phosphate oxidase